MTAEPKTRKRTVASAGVSERAETQGPIIKFKTGYVVSDKMQKSIVVRIDTLTPHPLYKKRVRKSKRFMVHDENNEAHAGDFVRIVESRPTSKKKSWKLATILRPGGSRAIAEEMVKEEVAAEIEAESAPDESAEE